MYGKTVFFHSNLVAILRLFMRFSGTLCVHCSRDFFCYDVFSLSLVWDAEESLFCQEEVNCTRGPAAAIRPSFIPRGKYGTTNFACMTRL